MSNKEDGMLRVQLAGLLDNGLDTEWRQRAYVSEEVVGVKTRLLQVAQNDYVSKLKIGGFTTHPYIPPQAASHPGTEIEQSCATCMYYERNRKYCCLPELDFPVGPKWSCVLWRI